MKMMNAATIKAINQALLFNSRFPFERPEVRPGQFVEMEDSRVGLPVFAKYPTLLRYNCGDRETQKKRSTGWCSSFMNRDYFVLISVSSVTVRRKEIFPSRVKSPPLMLYPPAAAVVLSAMTIMSAPRGTLPAVTETRLSAM